MPPAQTKAEARRERVKGPGFWETLRGLARVIEKIANTPVEVREIFAEASRRERAAEEEFRRSSDFGRMFDGPGSIQSFAHTAEQVARERGYDLRAWAAKIKPKADKPQGPNNSAED